MVTRRQAELLGATEVAFRFCTTMDDFEQVVLSITENAKAGDTHAQRLFLAYVEGLPRKKEKRTTKLELGSLDTVAGCGQALEQITQAAAQGRITAEDAATYSSLVTERLRAHQIQLGQEPEPTSGREIHVHVNGMSGKAPLTN